MVVALLAAACTAHPAPTPRAPPPAEPPLIDASVDAAADALAPGQSIALRCRAPGAALTLRARGFYVTFPADEAAAAPPHRSSGAPQMIHRRALFLAPLLVAGCASAPPPAPSTNAIAPAATAVAVAEPADAAAAGPSEPRFSGARVLLEAPWPLPAVPGLRFALLDDPDQPHSTRVGWEDATGRGGASLLPGLPGDERAQRISMLDVTGDGAADAVVWLDPATVPSSAVAHRVEVFTWSAAQHEPRRAAWTSLALGAVADDDALRAAGAAARGFVLPEAAPSLDAVVLRLGFATAAQFRSLVAPGGLVRCDVATGNARPHYRRCRTLTAAAVTDAFYAEHLRATVTLFESPADPDDAALIDSYEACRTVGARVVCGIPTGGPATTDLTFTGPASARRLSRVETTVYEDS